MKTLFIPPLGTLVTLAAPWTFRVFNERRNESLVKWMGKFVGKDSEYVTFPLGQELHRSGTDWYQRSHERFINCTLPKGTELRIDRIYIRKGQDGFDSVTFFLKGAATKAEAGVTKGMYRQASLRDGAAPWSGDVVTKDVPYERAWKKPARAVRFWAKLEDVNGMKIK